MGGRGTTTTISVRLIGEELKALDGLRKWGIRTVEPRGRTIRRLIREAARAAVAAANPGQSEGPASYGDRCKTAAAASGPESP
jgi:hypothetical protein